MALRLVVDGEGAQVTDGQGTQADAEFRVAVAHEHGGVRVRPIGEVDLATIGRLRGRMQEAIAAGAGRVVLDLRATTFLDATGLRLVVDTETWATRSGTEFVIIAGPPVVQRVFDAAGLSARLPFADGVQPLAETTGVDCPGGGPRYEQSV